MSIYPPSVEHSFDGLNVAIPSDKFAREEVRTVNTGPGPRPTLVDFTPSDFRRHLPEALSIYVQAMNYPRGTERSRAPMWTEHTTRRSWQGAGLLVERDGRQRLAAIAYGYRGEPQQWWQEQVRHGMRASRWPEDQIRNLLSNYFELTELHVRPDEQGQGFGEALLRHLTRNRDEHAILLSTPEVAGEANRAWHLYRRLGFRDVVRNFTFTGDARPFAVLGRALPFEPAEGRPL